MRLAQLNKFNTAMSTARSLDVDMTELFVHLTTQCLKLSRHPNNIPYVPGCLNRSLDPSDIHNRESDTSDWLLTDRVSSWPGTPADRGWRYLRQSLERHDSPDTDFKYTKITLETILSYDRLTPPPPWLIQILEVSDGTWNSSKAFLIHPCRRITITSISSGPPYVTNYSMMPWNTYQP
jgi:hypothetical protein